MYLDAVGDAAGAADRGQRHPDFSKLDAGAVKLTDERSRSNVCPTVSMVRGPAEAKGLELR